MPPQTPQQRWYENNKELAKERARKWRLENSEYDRNRKKKYRKEHPEVRWNSDLVLKYHITLQDYNSILDAQGGACAICRVISSKRMHVDHCHETGRIRGLLCANCNTAIGLLKDNTQFLASAITYLTK